MHIDGKLLDRLNSGKLTNKDMNELLSDPDISNVIKGIFETESEITPSMINKNKNLRNLIDTNLQSKFPDQYQKIAETSKGAGQQGRHLKLKIKPGQVSHFSDVEQSERVAPSYKAIRQSKNLFPLATGLRGQEFHTQTIDDWAKGQATSPKKNTPVKRDFERTPDDYQKAIDILKERVDTATHYDKQSGKLVKTYNDETRAAVDNIYKMSDENISSEQKLQKILKVDSQLKSERFADYEVNEEAAQNLKKKVANISGVEQDIADASVGNLRHTTTGIDAINKGIAMASSKHGRSIETTLDTYIHSLSADGIYLTIADKLTDENVDWQSTDDIVAKLGDIAGVSDTSAIPKLIDLDRLSYVQSQRDNIIDRLESHPEFAELGFKYKENRNVGTHNIIDLIQRRFRGRQSKSGNELISSIEQIPGLFGDDKETENIFKGIHKYRDKHTNWKESIDDLKIPGYNEAVSNNQELINKIISAGSEDEREQAIAEFQAGQAKIDELVDTSMPKERSINKKNFAKYGQYNLPESYMFKSKKYSHWDPTKPIGTNISNMQAKQKHLENNPHLADKPKVTQDFINQAGAIEHVTKYVSDYFSGALDDEPEVKGLVEAHLTRGAESYEDWLNRKDFNPLDSFLSELTMSAEDEGVGGNLTEASNSVDNLTDAVTTLTDVISNFRHITQATETPASNINESTEEKLNRFKSSSPNTRQNYVPGEFNQMMANAQKMSVKDALDPDKDFVEIDKLIENVKKSAIDIPAAVQAGIKAGRLDKIESGDVNIAAEDANILPAKKSTQNPFGQMFGRKPKEWGKNMAEALGRDPQTPGFDMDRFKGDPNKFYGASTSAMFTALDMAFVRQQKYRAGQYPTGQELAADRGYQSIYEQGFKGQQYVFDLSKYSDEDRARIGNAVTKAIENTTEPIIDEKTGELIGERATWGTSHKGDAAAEAIATGRLQISTENMSPEQLVKALKAGGIKDESEIQSLLEGGEQYSSVREMEASDVDIAKKFANVKVRQQQMAGIGDTINKMRHFSVELNMSMLGLMFSALSFIGILTQGITKLLQPLQDLQATFKDIGMAMAFGSENAKRFAKDVDPGTLIQGWMDLQGVMAGLQSMMASLSTKILDSGFFDRLDTAIGLLGDTLTKPENLQLFGDLIDKLIEAIPSAISGLEIALGIVDWINNLFERIGLNLFGVIAMAGLFGTILLPVFAIINAAMQFLQFTVSGIILRTVAWVHQLMFAEPILSRLVGYTTAVKNNLALASRNIMLILGAFGALSYLLGGMDTGIEETVNIKYEGQDDKDSIGGVLQWIGENITGIYFAALAASAVLPLYTAFTALHTKYLLWKFNADKAAAWIRLKEYFLNLKSSSINQTQGATTNSILSQLLSHQISQGIGGGIPVIGAVLGTILGVILAWWGWTKSQVQTTNITVNPNTGEVTEKRVQKLATGGDVKRGGLFNLHSGEAVINSAATDDMVERLEKIDKNTGESAAGIGLLERAVSYLDWAGLNDARPTTTLGAGGDGGEVKSLWDKIKSFFGVPEDGSFFTWLWETTTGWITDTWDNTMSIFGEIWSRVYNWIWGDEENPGWLQIAWDRLYAWIWGEEDQPGWLRAAFDRVVKWIWDEETQSGWMLAAYNKIMAWIWGEPDNPTWFSEAVGRLKKAVDDIIEHIKSMFPGSEPFIDGVIGAGVTIADGMTGGIFSSIFGNKEPEEVQKIVEEQAGTMETYWSGNEEKLKEFQILSQKQIQEYQDLQDGIDTSLTTVNSNMDDAATNTELKTDEIIKSVTNMTDETEIQMGIFVGHVRTAIAKAVAAAYAAASASYNSDLSIS